MPDYNVTCRCEDGMIHNVWYPIADGVPDWCPDCGDPFVQHISPPNLISASTVVTNRVDTNLSADRDAYKRLRAQGLQPQHVGGSSVLERHAETQFEIEAGHLFPTAHERAQVREGQERAAEMAEQVAEINKAKSVSA